MKNRNLITALILSAVLSASIVIGCSKAKNDLTIHGCEASDCHLSTQLMEFPPQSGKHSQHLSSSARISCATCHGSYLKNPLHKNGIVNGYNAINKTQMPGNIIFFSRAGSPGAGWDNSQSICSDLGCHGNANWYSTEETTCTFCHSPGSAYDPVALNGSGEEGKHSRHVNDKNIPCTRCHNDYPESSNHKDGTLDAENPLVQLVHFDGRNPSGQWTGDTGPQSGDCASLACHGTASLAWYGTNTWSLPDCSECHRAAIGSRRQVLDSNGDGSGTGGDFNRDSHHVIDYASRNSQIVTSADCQVCHDMNDHMGGTVSLNDKDNPGQAIAYDTSDASSLENFCLSCHDSDGATTEAGNEFSPFSSSNQLGAIPNQAGALVKENWNKQYGHRQQGLTCMGDGTAGSGCHGNSNQINAHGSNNLGLLTGGMNFLIESADDYDETDYALCFSCHAGYPGKTKEDILGVLEGGAYDFDHGVNGPLSAVISYGYPPYYNDGISVRFIDTDAHIHHSETASQYQLHWFHLGIRLHGYSSSWLYRGEGTSSSCSGCHVMHSGPPDPPQGNKMSCTACHSVHGSNTSFGSLYDEFMMTHNAGESRGDMGIQGGSLFNGPFYCGLSSCHCNHSSSGEYHRGYIFDPANE